MERGDLSTQTHIESPHARERAKSSPTAESHESDVAAAIDHATARRMRAFHTYGVISGLVGIAVSFALGGHELARTMFCVGLGVFSLANLCILIFAQTREQMETPFASLMLWGLCGLGLVPAFYYFGPFSAVTLVSLIAISTVAIGRNRLSANTVMFFSVGAHVAITVPMIAGWMPDVGILSSRDASGTQLAISELLIILLFVSGYGIGRWFRYTTRDALGELADARRMIDDQKQALDEINVAVARANRRNEGRWTAKKLGSWQLGLVLGRGAMGEVYEAAGVDGRQAAVKLLGARAEGSDSLVERFHREMNLAAKLSSPHIVQVYEVSPPDAEVPFIAMERLRGSDLATRLRNELRLSLDELTELVKQVARGLDVAHASGIVHRDLKPHNLFSHGDQWKILDFGVAKVMGSEGTLTEGAIIGTPNYMAPEQAAGLAVTHLADVYALGAIIYRCLTGRPPYAGGDVPALLYQVVHMRPPRPASRGNIARGIEDVLAIAMAKDPKARFQSARELAEQFVLAQKSGALSRSVPTDAWS